MNNELQSTKEVNKRESHFVDYWAEERGETCYLDDRGFITYKVYENPGQKEKEIMICDFFITKEARLSKLGKQLADKVAEIGKENGCTHMSCYIQHPDSSEHNRKRTTYKLKTFIHYGFVLHSCNSTQILLYKDL